MNINNLITFILGVEPTIISENVIIAPCWRPDSVGISAQLVSNQSCTIWHCQEYDLTYIVCGVGSCFCADVTMILQYTRCKRALFLGSAGALDERIGIGDIVIPDNVYCAEGASRFLYEDLSKDIFGKMYNTDNTLSDFIRSSIKNKICESNIQLHRGNGISVESIFSQYDHIEDFINMNCTFIDMESSAFLAASEKIGIPSTIVYCISDNVISGKPLYNTSKEETEFRKRIRKKIIPDIISAFVK